MRVLIKTALSPYSGYGNDGIGLTQALLRAGADVSLDPIAVSPPLPRAVTDLLTKRLVAPFDLLIQHADPGALGVSPPARRSAHATVAWTMWEYTSFDNLRGRSTLRKRLKDFDLVVGYDPVTTGALDPYAPERTATIQGGFDPTGWPKVTRDWTGPRFGFCMVGQLHQRKDPFVAIQAFKELKDEHPDEFEPAELHLKGQPLDAPVLTPTGWMPIGLLQPGDLVVDPAGGYQKVEGVQDLGEQEIYEVLFRDGSRVECTADHLWQVRGEYGPWRVMTVEQLQAEGIRSDHHLRWEVPLVEPPELESGEPRELDPYLLGLLLGDGVLHSMCPGYGSADQELIDLARAATPEGSELKFRYQRGMFQSWEFVGREGKGSVQECAGPGPHAPSVKRVRGLCRTCYARAYRTGTVDLWAPVGRVARPNIVGAALAKLGLRECRSWDKFVPAAYMTAPAAVRLEVLRGLMDTDGTAPTMNAGPTFTTVSPQLAQDVRDLIHSLGGTASVHTVQSHFMYAGERKHGRKAFHIKVNIPVNPFRLTRKADQWDAIQARRRHQRRHRIVAINPAGRRLARCILVSGVEGLYVTSDYVVTHNTNVPGLHPAMQQWVPKLRIHYTVWPTDVLREFYAAQHCLLAPSRGEGKNVPALEFMSTGGAVIATNWGGHQGWMSANHAYPLDYTLVPVSPTTPDCCNARANKEHLKDLMLHVFRHRIDARDRGERAAKLIPAMCSWDAVVQRLFDRLRGRVPGGDRLLHDLGAGLAHQREPVGV